MSNQPPFDPRAVANCLLDFAWQYEIEVTHLALQKTLYFLHEKYLKKTGQPLLFGHFVAWRHGPVHPQIWTTFKVCGREPIRKHAYRLDLESGLLQKPSEISDKKITHFIAVRGSELLLMPAHELVGLSHSKGGAWDMVTRSDCGQREYGSRISDELILKSNPLMVPIREGEGKGDILDEQPPT